MAEQKPAREREQHSTRLRHTLEIARMCGFEYQGVRKNRYGGFFTVFQLETILTKLRKLETLEREGGEAK